MPSAPASSAMTPTRRPSAPRPRFADASGGSGRQARRVQRVVARDRVQEQGRVGHVGGKRADLVERARERDQAVARNHTVGRFGPYDPAKGGRLADGAAGVAPEGERCKTCGYRRGAPPGGPARDPVQVDEGCGSGQKRNVLLKSPLRTRPYSSCR